MRNKPHLIILIVLILLISTSVSAHYESSEINTVSTDTTPPVTTHYLDGEKLGRFYTGEVIFSLSATDDESGVKEIWIGILLGGGGGAMVWKKYTEPVTVTGIGWHTFDYWSTDNAGNKEETTRISFAIVEDLGFLFTLGNFTEQTTKYSGEYNLMFFIGVVDGKFDVVFRKDETLELKKSVIIKELVVDSKIILAKIGELPE